MQVKALLFDVFGTVVDWRTGVARDAERILAPLGHKLDWLAFADAWRDQYQPGMEEVRWMKPVRPGDTLSMQGHVLGARVSKSRPEMGILDIEWRLFNQAGQVALMRVTGLYAVRNPAVSA